MTHLTIEYLKENSSHIASFLGIAEELEISENEMFGNKLFYLYYGETELVYIKGDGVTREKDPVNFRKYVVIVEYGLNGDYDLIHNYSFRANSKYSMIEVMAHIRQQKVSSIIN